MGRFDGQSVVVTGTASGIGRATARQFGGEGGRVVCADIDGAGAETTAAAIRDAGGDAVGVACDVSDPASARAAIDEAVKHFDGLSVLANVAGIGRFDNTHELPLETWHRTIAVNLTGVFLTCQAALPHLLESRGAVVNVASIAGLKGQAYSAAYAASKGGVVMLTRSLAVEYGGRGVRFNCVCPGGVNTNILGGFMPPDDHDRRLINRQMALNHDMAEPEEIAHAIAYLASDDARRCMGTVLVIDGGTIA
jgi:NAD(P)-dependent dehydrogenase (short-subunit alcohol dehydrogenase family)